MNIYLINEVDSDFTDIKNSINRAVSETKNSLFLNSDNSDYVGIQETIKQSDYVIVDVTRGTYATAFDYGFARGCDKQVLPIAEIGKPIQLTNDKTILYNRQRLGDTLYLPLLSFLSSKDNLSSTKSISTTIQKRKTVFVSYAHMDLEFLTRLQVHLKPFEKNGQIDLWADTKIKAGDKWKEKIELALEKSVMAILLISADFLASDFIVDNELPPLLKAAEEKGTAIIPLICKPCRFTKNENLSKFQTINDPQKSLSKLTETEKEEIFVKLADIIESAL